MIAFISKVITPVATSGDADVDPIITDLTTGQSLENNTVVVISGSSVSLVCNVDPPRRPPFWRLTRANGVQQYFTANHTDSVFTVTSSLNSSHLVGQYEPSTANSLVGTYCCFSMDGDDLLLKCVTASNAPIKAPYNVHVKVGTFENVTEGESKAVVVPKGIPLTLTCSFPDDVHPAPVVRWTRDGVVLDEDSTSLVLQDPNGGMYSCSVSNQVESASSGNVTLLLKGSLNVSVEPSLSILTPTHPTTNLSCVTDNPFHQSLSFKWRTRGSSHVISTRSYLYLEGDVQPGDYQCTVEGSLGAAASDTSEVIVVQKAFLQLVIEDIPNCGYVHAPSIDVLRSSVSNTLVQAVNRHCSCGFTSSNILSNSFKCYPDGYRHAVYRAEVMINATAQFNTDILLDHVQRWVTTGASVVAGERRYAVSTLCPVGIASLDEELCDLDRPTTFTITDNMIYSFLIGIGFALIILIALILIFCCLIKCRYYVLSKKQRKKKEKNSKPIIELIQHTGLEPPEPLDPTLSIRTNTSWSSVLRDKAPSRQNLAGSRESIRSDTDEVIQARSDLSRNKNKYRHQSGGDSPDSGLILHANGTRGSVIGSTQSLPNKPTNESTPAYHQNEEGGDFNLGITPSLEELVDELHPPSSMEVSSEPNVINYPYYPAPVSRSLQRLDKNFGDVPVSSPASPQVISRGQVKSETLNMTATDEMLKLIEEVRAARAAFQQILDRTPEGSPVLSRNSLRTQSFREPGSHPGRDMGNYRGSDPNMKQLRATRTGSGTGIRPGVTIDGSNASMNAYWIEKLRAAKLRQGGSSPLPPVEPSGSPNQSYRKGVQSMYDDTQYDQLEPRSQGNIPRKNGIAGVSPLAKNNQVASPNNLSHSQEFFPPPPPPATAFSQEGQVAGGPVFVPVPVPPAAMSQSVSSSSFDAPLPPPPPPVPGEVPPPVPKKPKKSTRPLSHSGVDRFELNQASLKDGLGRLRPSNGDVNREISRGGSLRGLSNSYN